MSDLKQPGQRAYEVMCSLDRGGSYPWADISQYAKNAWAAVEQACAVPAEPGQAGKAQRWIPVEERLPAWRERVLLLTSDTKKPHRIGYWDDRDDAEEEPSQDPFWCDDQSWFGDHHDGLVTHWQPLPSPPTKDPTNV